MKGRPPSGPQVCTEGSHTRLLLWQLCLIYQSHLYHQQLKLLQLCALEEAPQCILTLLTRSAVNPALSLTMESLKCWEGSTCPRAFCLFQTDSSTLVSLVSTAQLEDNIYPVYRVSRVHRVCSVHQAQ